MPFPGWVTRTRRYRSRVLVLVATHPIMKGVLMARRGPKRRLDVESQYWRLLLSGVGTVEACRAVGIGRKTGYRWRPENGGLPPVRLAETARSTRYLSLLERQRIAPCAPRG